MRVKTCAKPCKGCPFRKDAMKGWLGAYESPEEFITVHYRQDGVNPCHMAVDYEQDDWRDRLPDATGCAGQQIMYMNSCKLPRTWLLDPDLDEDRENIFTTPAEFIAHHTMTGRKRGVPFDVVQHDVDLGPCEVRERLLIERQTPQPEDKTMSTTDTHTALALVRANIARFAVLGELWGGDDEGTRVRALVSLDEDEERVIAFSKGPTDTSLRFEVGDAAGYIVSTGTITFDTTVERRLMSGVVEDYTFEDESVVVRGGTHD